MTRLSSSSIIDRIHNGVSDKKASRQDKMEEGESEEGGEKKSAADKDDRACGEADDAGESTTVRRGRQVCSKNTVQPRIDNLSDDTPSLHALVWDLGQGVKIDHDD